MTDEEIMVPYIPDGILRSLKEDYPYIQELLEYKKNGTLVFLKGQGAISF